MDKRLDAAQVNSSYTIFFGIATVAITYVFSTSFGVLHDQSLVIIIGFSLLLYFIWDFIKQLYSPGQSVFIYSLAFIIMPFILSITIGGIFWATGAVTWLLATIFAGILEILYELLFKSMVPKNIMKRLLVVDNKIDKSLVQININQLTVYDFRGLAFAVCLIAAYYFGVVLLLYTTI